MKRIALLLAVLLSFMLSSMTAAQTTDCDRVVIDGAGIFKEKTTSGTEWDRTFEVEAAAAQLASHGATVRIRTVQSTADIDKYQESLVSQCSSWENSDHNLIIFLVSMDPRKIRMDYDNKWDKTLDSTNTGIVNNTIVPYLKENQYADGIIAGINETTRLLSGKPAIPTAVPATVSKPSETEKPRDYTAFWVVALTLLLSVALIFGMAQWISAREKAEAKAKAEEEARREARLNAITVKDEAFEYIRKLDEQIGELDQGVQFLEGSIDEATVATLKRDLESLQSQHATLSVSLESKDAFTSSLEHPDLSEAEADQIQKSLKEIVDQGNQLTVSANQIQDKIDHLEELIRTTPEQLSAAQQSLSELQKLIEQAEDQDVSAGAITKLVSQIESVLQKATSAHEKHDLISAQELLGKVVTDCDQLTALLKEIPELPRKIQDCRAQLTDISTFLNVHQEEIETEGYVRRLKDTTRELEQVERGITSSEPNYPVHVKTLMKVQGEATELDQDCQAALATARAELKEAQEKRAEAADALEKAQERIDRHPGRISEATRRSYEQAREQLNAAENAASSNQALSFALLALTMSQESHSHASADTRPPSTDYGSSSGHSNHSSGNESSFSGSSASFGSISSGTTSGFDGGSSGTTSDF